MDAARQAETRIDVRERGARALTAALVEESRDALFALSPAGEVLSWNRGARSMLGYAPEEAVGRSIEDFAAPGHEGETARAIEQALAEGGARFDTVRRCKHGPPVDVDVWLHTVRDRHGRVCFVAAHERDATLLRRLQRERASQSSFRDVVEAAPDAMVITGEDGRIALVNGQTESLFGYARGELVGQPVEILVPERFRTGHLPRRAGYLVDPRTRPMGAGLDLFARRRDGSEFPAEISLSPTTTTEGRLVIAVIRDVTERRECELALREASRMKSERLANMSHDLRTPLSAIIGFAEVIHDGRVPSTSALLKELVGDILSSGMHLLRLIDDILELSRVEAGKLELRPELLDVGEVVREIAASTASAARKKNVVIEVESDPALGFVLLDRARLRQVVAAYLSSALTLLAPGGRVSLRVRILDRDSFALEVDGQRDGAAADIGRLLVELQQLDAGAARRHGGSGLALALAKRIVEAHGGSVGIARGGRGGGVFAAVLPRRLAVRAVPPLEAAR
ncbi:MAG: PAS domain S-box protein [Thermodesulfobacteriota bacterium]